MKYIKMFLLLVIFTNIGYSMSLDQKLSLIKDVYSLEAKECNTPINELSSDPIFEAGKELFETKILSSNYDTSCISCHIDSLGSADGLPMAVGVNSTGEGIERYKHGKGILVQRNALSLKGRAEEEFINYFWDGKAQIQDGEFISQFGSDVSKKFDSIFAVASILPLIERDEFIDIDGEINRAVGDKLYKKRYDAISQVIKNRLQKANTPETVILAKKLRLAGIDINKFELADAGNLLAKFFEKKFPCEISDWDKYLKGDINAISDSQKKGAILFYGKGRCVSCHSGKFFSDFNFHSIGTPQGYFGPHTRHRDIGRGAVTSKAEDLYKFRTPPLTLVKETSPYGHSGAFKDLQSVIIHHINPIEFYKKNPTYYEADFYNIGKQLGSRDKVLEFISIDSQDEINDLIDFLNSI